MTPYRNNGNLNDRQILFNTRLSSRRVIIENAFGLLKEKFRQIHYCRLRGIPTLCHFVRACFVLHNLATDPNTQFDDNDNVIEEQADDPPPTQLLGEDDDMLETGINLRDIICETLNDA